MYQIKETDFLWKCYVRNNKGEASIPHPHSICNYFWQAVAGMFRFVFCDLSVLLVVPALAGTTFLAGWYSATLIPTNKVLLTAIGFLVTTFLGFGTIAVIWLRFMNFTERCKHTEMWRGIASVTTGLAFALFGCGLEKGQGWSFVTGITRLGIVTGVSVALFAIIVSVVYMSTENPTAKAIRELFSGIKQRACPLVKAPWEKDNAVQCEHNAGDGVDQHQRNES